MVTTRPPKTIVKPSALGPVANTDTKLLIYGLFQKGGVLAQDAVIPAYTKLLIDGLFQRGRVLAQDAVGSRERLSEQRKKAQRVRSAANRAASCHRCESSRAVATPRARRKPARNCP